MIKNKRLLIIAAVLLAIVMVIAFVVAKPKKKTNIPDPIVTTDPITGDKLIETPGVDPETGDGESSGLALIGSQKLYDYMDDDYTFYLLRDGIFSRYFKEKVDGKAKLLKIVPSSLTTRTIGGGSSGNAQKTAAFTLLTDLNDDPYQVSMTILPVEGEIFVDIKDKNGVVNSYKDFTKLVD